MHGVSLSIGSVDPLDFDYLAPTEGAGRSHRTRVDLGSPVLDRSRWPQLPRPDAVAVRPRGGSSRCRAGATRAGLSRAPDSARERVELSRVPTVRNDGVGIRDGSCRSRGLPVAARRQQRLRQLGQSRLRRAGPISNRYRANACSRSTWPGIATTATTSSTATISRSSMRCGISTSTRSNGLVRSQR